MKKGAIIGFLFLAIALLLWRYRNQPPAQETQASLPTRETQQGQTASPVLPTTVKPTPESNPAAWIETRQKQMEADRQNGLNEWRTPIEFFGQVFDENTNPVANADVHFVWTDLSQTGNSEKQAVSDGNGLFSLRNVTGKNLIVQVSKTDYYPYQRFGAAFNYAGENRNFIPDQGNPIVFSLKKKGVAEPLVQIAEKFSVPRTGTPVEVDLITGKQVSTGQGQFRVECWTDEAKGRGLSYNWKCRITVPGGGLLPFTNQFDFLAPLEGYTSSDEINMPTSLGEQWSRSAKRSYFLKLSNGNYARVSFEMISFNNHVFKLGAFTNPSGSRNLEYDPAVQPKQTQFE